MAREPLRQIRPRATERRLGPRRVGHARRDLRNEPDRLWDLRRGDADDNRTSPYGRGWRSVIVSAALEFNYLTASIAFLSLVIIPALLVGLAPPLLVTYGRKGVGAAALIQSYPMAALLLLTLLVGTAIWIGRSVFSMAADNFWHLHYTLVFPIFVGLREIFCAGMEALPGQTMASEQLDRRRRIGTCLAALLLACGGVALALTVGVSTGPRRIEVANLRFWTVTAAALGNALVVLGLSTAIESLFWLWREITSSRPVRNWSPDARTFSSPTVRVAHLSDLHVVGERYGYRMESGTHGPRGNSSIRRALLALDAIHRSTPLDRVLVTGDVTDAGTRAEWLAFTGLLEGHPQLRSRVLFVPGNHDVNIVDRTNTGRLDLPWSTGQALRKLRFVLALDEIQGQRTHVVDRASGSIGPSLRHYLREGGRPALLRALAERGSWRGRREMGRVWRALFPLIVPPSEHGGFGIILLDSNAPSHFSLTNAIGVVERTQLAVLKTFLRASPPDRAWIILLHHHVVEYPIPSVGLHERIGLALVNAPEVLTAIAPYASHVLILHGHRHRDWIGTSGQLTLCSAPSVSMGSVGPDLYQGSFHIYELAVGADGEMRLAESKQVRVA